MKHFITSTNIADEARSHGIEIDTAGLERELGIPVIETVAVEGRGMDELRHALTRAAVATIPLDEARRAQSVREGSQWAHEMALRYRKHGRRSVGRFQEWLGRAVREPVTGIPILALVLYVTYLFVGVFGAQTLVGLLEHGLFAKAVNPAAAALAKLIPVALVRDFFVGEYGLVTMGLTYAIAIVLPVVPTFFLIFGGCRHAAHGPRAMFAPFRRRPPQSYIMSPGRPRRPGG